MDRRSFLLATAMSLLTVPTHARVMSGNHWPKMVMSNKKIDFSKEPKRVRKAFYDLTNDELENLIRAVGYMRNNFPLHHPLQWDNYATVHAMHCTEYGPEYPQVHWSWNFLPWHRGYLFCLERILGNILTTKFNIDGSTFALPYWDWTTQKTMPNTKDRIASKIPSPFFGYDIQKEDLINSDGLGFDNSALYEGNRGPSVESADINPEWELTEDSKQHIEEFLHYISPEYLSMMLAAPADQFIGHPDIDRKTGQGLLEQGPHNDGHDWVGSRIGKNRTMGTLRSAAKDPMFYMHHCCIDYVWSQYKQPQPDPKGDWGKQTYTFFDVDGSTFTMSNQEIIEGVTNITYVPSSEGKPLETARRPLMQTKAQVVQVNADVYDQPVTIDLPDDFFNHQALLVDFTLDTIDNPDKYTIRLKINNQFVGKINWLDGEHRIHNQSTTHVFSVLLLGVPKSKSLTFVPPKANADKVTVKTISYKVL